MFLSVSGLKSSPDFSEMLDFWEFQEKFGYGHLGNVGFLGYVHNRILRNC